MFLKTILEAAGVLLIVHMVIHEQDLIDFEIRLGERIRAAAKRAQHRLVRTVQDLKAIRRACRRQGIGAGRFLRLLLGR